MSNRPDPSQEESPFTRAAAISGVALGAVLGFIAGSLEGVTHNLGGRTDVVLAIVGAALGGWIGYSSYKRYLARSNEEKSWCRDHGWIWLGDRAPWGRGVADFKTGVKKSHIFMQGASWSDVLVRDEGETPAIFCRRYRRDDNSNTVEEASFVIVHYSGDCPDTTLESRSFSWLPSLGRRKKVEFESTDFNKHWNVRSEDAKAAYDRIDQSTIEFLETNDVKPAIELIDQILLIKFSTSGSNRSNRESCLRWAEHFSRAVPDDLLQPLSLLKTS